jgi:peptidoglycan hydrolase-like protein with peptidoglycan-binding domain
LAAPSLEAVLAGDVLHLGHAGEAVRLVQALLVARAIELLIDGLFGPETQAGVRAFQRAHGCTCDGVVGPETLMALGRTSPRRRSGRSGDAPAPRHRQLPIPTAPTTEAPSREPIRPPIHAPIPTGGPADQRLAALQSQAVRFAEGETGVRETGGNNRGARVDQYARNAGMPVGGEWCAYFVNFAYSETARANGGDFSGRLRLHSYQKNYAYFAYGSYTARDQRRAREDGLALRAQHEAQGSTRRYMAIEGSDGHRYAASRNLPHEVYRDHRELPIREGDTALFRRGHVGMVKSYDPSTGQLVTMEGNTAQGVCERRYDLSDPAVLARFDGFGRPALGDLTGAGDSSRNGGQ